MAGCELQNKLLAFEVLQRQVDLGFYEHTCPPDLHDWLCEKMTATASSKSLRTSYVNLYMALRPDHFTWYRCPSCDLRL